MIKADERDDPYFRRRPRIRAEENFEVATQIGIWLLTFLTLLIAEPVVAQVNMVAADAKGIT